MSPGLLKRLQNLDEYDFELLIAEIWEKRGWETEVTSETSDRGIDVVATRESPFSEKQLIQAKCYSKGNKIGGPDIRQYASLRQQEDNIDAVVVVTTSDFTQQARQVARDTNVKLINGKSLIDLIPNEDFEALLERYSVDYSTTVESSGDDTRTIANPSERSVDFGSTRNISDEIPRYITYISSNDITSEMSDRMKLGAMYTMALSQFMSISESTEFQDSYNTLRDQVLEKCSQTDEFIQTLESAPMSDMPPEFKQPYQDNINLWDEWADVYLQLIEKFDRLLDENTGVLRCPECNAQLARDITRCNRCGAGLEEGTRSIMEVTNRAKTINNELGNKAEKMTEHITTLKSKNKMGTIGEEPSGTSGCFIATAAYGSPTEPEIDTLREFRDNILAESRATQWTIPVYYNTSPPIARWIAKSELRMRLVRRFVVRPMVRIVRRIWDPT